MAYGGANGGRKQTVYYFQSENFLLQKIRNPFELTFNELVTILAGDNGVGKSTIVEAINLALSGRYRDAPIGRSVSEYLFNKDDVALFANSSQP